MSVLSAIISFDTFNPETLIRLGGLTLLLIIIFTETGVFFGFFLPGDSLLFVAGLLSDSEYINVPLPLLIVLLIISAFAGSTVGYFTGRWAGNYLLKRKENFFFKKKYLEVTREVYTRYGMMAFIVGRFLPVVRTFVPIMAGMTNIEIKKFLFYNFTGASIWIVTFVLAGHWLGNAFPFLIDYIEIIVAGMIVVSAIPVVWSWLKNRKSFDPK